MTSLTDAFLVWIESNIFNPIVNEHPELTIDDLYSIVNDYSLETAKTQVSHSGALAPPVGQFKPAIKSLKRSPECTTQCIYKFPRGGQKDKICQDQTTAGEVYCRKHLGTREAVNSRKSGYGTLEQMVVPKPPSRSGQRPGSTSVTPRSFPVANPQLESGARRRITAPRPRDEYDDEVEQPIISQTIPFPRTPIPRAVGPTGPQSKTPAARPRPAAAPRSTESRVRAHASAPMNQPLPDEELCVQETGYPHDIFLLQIESGVGFLIRQTEESNSIIVYCVEEHYEDGTKAWRRLTEDEQNIIIEKEYYSASNENIEHALDGDFEKIVPEREPPAPTQTRQKVASIVEDVRETISHDRPAAQPIPRPVGRTQSIPIPAAQPIPRPAAQPIPRPAAQSIPRPAAQPIPRPAAQPIPRPAARPAAQPIPRPAAQPIPRPAARQTAIDRVRPAALPPKSEDEDPVGLEDPEEVDAEDVYQPEDAEDVYQPEDAEDVYQPEDAEDVYQPKDAEDVYHPEEADTEDVPQSEDTEDVPQPEEKTPLKLSSIRPTIRGRK